MNKEQIIENQFSAFKNILTHCGFTIDNDLGHYIDSHFDSKNENGECVRYSFWMNCMGINARVFTFTNGGVVKRVLTPGEMFNGLGYNLSDLLEQFFYNS